MSGRTIRACFLTTAAVASVMVLAGLALAASARAGNPTNPDDQIYLTYDGHLERQAWLGHTGTGQPFGKLDVTLEWQAAAHFPHQGSFGAGVDIDYQVLTGTISLDDKGDPSPQTSGLKSCDATLSERISSYQQTATTAFDLVSRRYKMNLYQPPLTAYLLKSSDTSGDYCTVNPAVSSAVGLALNQWPQPTNDPAYDDAWQEYDTFPGGRGPSASRFTNHYPGKEGVVEDITNTITASDAKLPGSGNEPPPQGPVFSKRQVGQLKDFYASDVKRAIDAAKPYCLNYLAGLGTFGTGVLLTGTGPVGSILAIAGSIVGTTTAPFCQAALTRIRDDVVIANDPPDRHFDAIAQPLAVAGVKLANCNRYGGSLRSSCRVLTADAQRLVKAARHLAAVANAASTTMNRYTAGLRRRTGPRARLRANISWLSPASSSTHGPRSPRPARPSPGISCTSTSTGGLPSRTRGARSPPLSASSTSAGSPAELSPGTPGVR